MPKAAFGNWQRRRRHSEDTPQCNHVPLTLSGLEQALANPVAAVNDWRLQQLCDWVKTEHGMPVGVEHKVEDPGAAWPESEKKSLHASEQMRPDVAQTRLVWQARQPDTPVSRLVFLDQTWASTDMAPARDRAAIGKRSLGRAPYGHWKTTTFYPPGRLWPVRPAPSATCSHIAGRLPNSSIYPKRFRQDGMTGRLPHLT